MSKLSHFFLKKIQFTYSLVAMFIFLSIVISLSANKDNYIFATSFVFFFLLNDLLERGMQRKRFAIGLSSFVLTLGIFLFIIEFGNSIHFHFSALSNLFLFNSTLILAVLYRISHRNPFLGIRTAFTLSNAEAWHTTHEVASKLLFFSLFFYVLLFAITEHPLVHFGFFIFNIVSNALLALWLSKQFYAQAPK